MLILLLFCCGTIVFFSVVLVVFFVRFVSFAMALAPFVHGSCRIRVALVVWV